MIKIDDLAQSLERTEVDAKKFNTFVTIATNVALVVNSYNAVTFEPINDKGLNILRVTFSNKTNTLQANLPVLNSDNLLKKGFSVNLLALKKILPFVQSDKISIFLKDDTYFVSCDGVLFPIETTAPVDYKVFLINKEDSITIANTDTEPAFTQIRELFKWGESILSLGDFEQSKFLVFNDEISSFSHNGILLRTRGFGFSAIITYKDIVSISRIFSDDDLHVDVTILGDDDRKTIIFTNDLFYYSLPLVSKEIRAAKLPVINREVFPIQLDLEKPRIEFLTNLFASFEVVRGPLSLFVEKGATYLRYAFRKDQVYTYSVSSHTAPIIQDLGIKLDSLAFSRVIRLLADNNLVMYINDDLTLIGIEEGVFSVFMTTY